MRSIPWTYLRVNLNSGRWEERPNPCPSPASVRDLVSFERASELTAGHEIVQLRAMMEGVPDVPQDRIRRLADWANLKFDFADAATRRESAIRLNDLVARSSTYFTLEKTISFAVQHGRRMMMALSYGGARIQLACAGKPKDPADTALIDWLRERDVPCFDVREAHLADFAVFRLSPEDYVNRYFNGHYNQRGNQFFALALKDSIVRWLDPKPPTYRPVGAAIDPRGDV